MPKANGTATSPLMSAKDVRDDFSRDVWSLFGLPIDNLSMSTACELAELTSQRNERKVLSTVNVNWLVMSLESTEFRSAILDSDICTLDGVPLVWLARSAGFPMREAVRGSSLIEHLMQAGNRHAPMSIFLFGGEPGVAEKAFTKINSRRSGLRAVGYFDPGFGTVDELSARRGLDAINAASPAILLLALGAYRGQLWIQRNRNRIKANIISHLGATINFLAQTERRAPRWLQAVGLEWAWRIVQRPSLWRRYLRDGVTLGALLVNRWLPYLLEQRHQTRLSARGDIGALEVTENGQEIIVHLGGALTRYQRNAISECFRSVATRRKHVTLDFAHASCVDGWFLGLILILLKHQARNGRNLAVANLDKRLHNVFRMNCMDKSFAAFGYSLTPSGTASRTDAY